MNTMKERADCFVCFSKVEMYVFPPVESAQEFLKVVNDCLNFLHEDIADNCKLNTARLNIEKRPTFCKKCFDCVNELTELNEQSSKLQKNISDKKIAFSMAVFFRRNQIEDTYKDSDTINNSQKQLIQLDMTGTPRSLFSINPTISATIEDVAHPVENIPFGMDVAVDDPPQSIGIEYCKKDVEDNTWVLPLSGSLEEMPSNINNYLVKEDNEIGVTIRKSSRIQKLNDTEISSMSKNDKESNQSDTSTSISNKSCLPKLSSDGGTRKNILRANGSNKNAEEMNCVKIRGTTDSGKLKTILCCYCTKSFISIATLKVHERKVHTENKDNKSAFCDKVFLESSKLQKHINVHTTKKLHKCSFCEKTFPFSCNLRIHERIHTGEKPLKCSYCEKGFTQPGHVRDHERTHTGEKPYKCYFCEKSFSASNNFQKHIRTHTGEKPYKCTFCEKAFNRCAKLKIHERNHTGEKPFKCSFCDKAFSILCNLKNHIRSHTGEKPYKCLICGDEYATANNLGLHKKSHT